MSTLTLRTITSPDGSPVAFPNGIRIGASGGSGNVNDIGIPGQPGFGVGIAPEVPAGYAALPGVNDPLSPNYGNYQYSDGSVEVYVPAHFTKEGTGANGLALNVTDYKPYSYFVDVATANAAGYSLDRAFYNGNSIRPGVFVDKYQCSNNGGIASSIRNASPLSSAADHNPFSALTGAPSNIYGGAIAAAKTRGSRFFCKTRFITGMLAKISKAHGQASTSATYCGWYMPGANFPKGNNNNALGDTNDSSVIYVSDGYSNCGKTGSANFPAKVSHNGQPCGVMDLNGNMWEIDLGLVSDGVNFYVLKTSVDVTTITGGNTLATDAWGANGIAAMYTSLGATYEALLASSSVKYFGSANQVLSGATAGNAWLYAGLGLPLANGVGGSAQFGNDGLWDYRPNELCVISGGSWDNGSGAGVWAANLADVRGASNGYVGFRAASYL